jgi:hypothetical protein
LDFLLQDVCNERTFTTSSRVQILNASQNRTFQVTEYLNGNCTEDISTTRRNYTFGVCDDDAGVMFVASSDAFSSLKPSYVLMVLMILISLF